MGSGLLAVSTFFAVAALLRHALPLSSRSLVLLSGGASSVPLTGSLLYTTLSNRAVPNKLSDPDQKGAVGQFHQADLVVLNRVEESLELKLRMVESATRSIEWCMSYASGKPLSRALDAIEKRLEVCPELKAHVMVSSVTLPAAHRQRLEELHRRFPGRFYALAAKPVHDTSHGSIRNEEVHAKALIVDGRYFNMGGSNMGEASTREAVDPNEVGERSLLDRLLAPAFRDTDVAGRGTELARVMRGQFFDLYRLWALRQETVLHPGEGCYFEVEGQEAACAVIDDHQKLRRGARAALFVGGPEHAGANPIQAEYMRRLSNAKSSVRIGSLYTRLTPELKEALAQAREREVKVTAIFPSSAGATPTNLVMRALNTDHYSAYDEVFEYRQGDAIYHAKKAIFDQSAALVGSYNFSWKSAYCDAEFALSIDSEEVAADLRKGFDEDRERSQLVTAAPCSLGGALGTYLVARLSMIDGISTG